MIGQIVLNVLTASQLAASPQSYFRNSRDNDYDYNRQGEYRMFGSLMLPGDGYGGFDSIVDSRSRYRYGNYYNGFRRSYDTREQCPYDNQQLLRKKRSANSTTEDSKKDSHTDLRSVLLARLRRQLYDGLSYSEYRSRIDGDGYYRRYDADRYNRRYDDRYYGRYDDDRLRGTGYDDRNWRDNRRYDDRRARTDLCGRPMCSWTAELECGNLMSYDRGYGYGRNSRMEWTREHDSFYPKDKYNNFLEYCGTRCHIEGMKLIIEDVRPEDKGVYRCYPEGSDRVKDFTEIKFYPKYPLSSNPSSLDDC